MKKSPTLLTRSMIAEPEHDTRAFPCVLVTGARQVGKRPRICYYRDGRGAEVDFLLERQGTITPVEVKFSTAPVLQDLKAAPHIPQGLIPLSPGIVLHSGTDCYPLGHGCQAFPLSAL